MLISLGDKNIIIEQYKLGNLDNAIKLLRKMENKGYNNREDKHFIYKTLAILYKKLEEKKEDKNDRDYKIAAFYSDKAFENIKDFRLVNEDQYYEVMWLNIGLNESIYSSQEIIEKYEEIKMYYDNIQYRRNSIALHINISKIKRDCKTILELLLEVIDYEEDIQFCGMESEILQDIKDIFGDTYYELALKKINCKRNGICIA